MALRVALVLDGNAQGARTAVQATAGDVDKLEKATERATDAMDALRRSTEQQARLPTPMPSSVPASPASVPTGAGGGGTPANFVRGGGAAANGNVANIAAQFQDIAVTSAMGMSPLQIALQQGTQLSAVLGSQGAAGAAKMLAAALGSVFNPVSLLTIAVVGLGAAALQAIGGWIASNHKATQSLEEHDKWLKEILSGYDAAAKAAKGASEAAQQMPKGAVQSNLEADQAEKLKQVGDRYKDIIALSAQFEAMAGSAKAFGVPPEVADQLAGLRDLLQSVTKDGQLTRAEADQLVVALTRLSNNNADRNLKDIAAAALTNVNALSQLIGMIDATTASLSTLQNQAAVAQFNRNLDATTAGIAKLKALAPDLRDGYQQAKDVLTETLKTAETPFSRFTAQDQYDKTIAALDAQKAQQAAKKAASAANKVSDYQREIEASREKTAATQLEIEMVGQSTLAAERARKVLELETAAKKDAIGLSPARIAAIQAEADASAQAAAELENTKGVWSEIQQAGSSAINSLLDSVLSGGKNITDVVKNIAAEWLKMVIQMSVTNPLQNALLGTNSPTFATGISSFIAGLFGKREAGGPVVAGRPYIVGERRPEIFVPTSSGTILPNTNVMAGAGGGGMRFSQTIINNSTEKVSSRQRQRSDGSVYQELVIGATQRGMENDQFRSYGIRPATKSR